MKTIKVKVCTQCLTLVNGASVIGDFYKNAESNKRCSPVFSDLNKLFAWKNKHFNSVQIDYNIVELTTK